MAAPIVAVFTDGEPKLLSLDDLRKLVGVDQLEKRFNAYATGADDRLGAVVDAANGAAKDARDNVVLAFEQIAPITSDLDIAKMAIDAQKAALEALTASTNDAFDLLDGAGARSDQAVRDIDRQLAMIAASTMRALLDNDTTRQIIRDAGISVDPASGKVSFWALDQVQDQTRKVELLLDAQAGILSQKVTVDQVEELITLAALDPSQIADLQPLIRRLNTVEQTLDGVQAQILQKASAAELMAQALKLSTVSTTLDALAGEVSTKASLTQVQNQEVRLTDLIQRFAATPDGARLDLELRQVRTISTTNQLDVLKGIVSADEGNSRQVAEIAEYRQSISTQITAGFSAQALATQTLSVAMGAMDARYADQIKTLVTTTGSQAERLGAIEASNDQQTAQIATLQRASVDNAVGVAGVIATVRQMLPREAAGQKAQLGQVLADDEATARGSVQLAQVQSEMTTRFVANELSAAQTKLLLEARIAGNSSLIGQVADAQATANAATARRIDAIDVRFGALSDNLAATTVTITRQIDGVATALSGTASDVATLSAEVRDPTTGLSASRALILSVDKASADRDSAMLTRIQAAEAALADPATGLAATVARLTGEIELSAQARSALASRIDTLQAQVIDPATGKPVWEGSIGDLRRVVLDGDQHLAEQIGTVSTTVDGQTSTISFLMRSINGNDAVAQLMVDVGAGKITGFRINGQDSLFAIAADHFIVGSSQVFEISNGITRIRNAVIGTATIDTLNLVGGAVSNTTTDVKSVNGVSASAAQSSDTTTITTAGGTIRIDVCVQVTRTATGVGALRMQLFSSDGRALSGQYKCPSAADSAPVTFMAIDTPQAGQRGYYVAYSVDSASGAAAYNATHLMVLTELKR